ncbi:hypothetical protein V8E54_011822 [Elaphomyces granulatus]
MKAMYALLVLLTAGVFTDPGTAIQIDQASCNGSSIILAYMDFLSPAVQSAFSMSTIAAQQLSNPAQMNSQGHWVDVIKDILMHVKLINKQTVREESKVQVVSYCEDQEGSTTYYAWTHVLSEDGTAVIQLCPWYMKLCLKKFEAGQPVYITPDALNSVRDLATRPSKLLDQPSQIDYFCLLDCVILHELTHTTRVHDIAYGWAGIRKLSNNGYKNADSYAYMGLGKNKSLIHYNLLANIDRNSSHCESRH